MCNEDPDIEYLRDMDEHDQLEGYRLIDEAARKWVALWPDHCKQCLGAGGKHYPATYWEPEDFDTCGECVDVGKCPRCGHVDALSEEDGSGPCPSCVWNYDDACPQY